MSGIPQGSSLGPLLFIIFINDLPNWVSICCKIFADDTKLYDVASNHVQIQTDIDALQRWSDKWNLYFNTVMCKVMHIGLNNQGYNYTMRLYNDEIVNITKCDNDKDLGVIFYNKMIFDYTFKPYISMKLRCSYCPVLPYRLL